MKNSLIRDVRNRGRRVWPTIRIEPHFPRRRQPLRVRDRQKNPIVVDVDPVAARRLDHGRGHMIGIGHIGMVMIVVMQEHLPSIKQLGIGRLGVAYRRRQVERGWVDRRIESAIHRAGDRHVWWRVVYRHDQRCLRG